MVKKYLSETLPFSFREAREYKGISMEECAKQMGTNAAGLSAMELTRGMISIKNLIRFWRVVDIDANIFLEELEKDVNALKSKTKRS